MSIWNKRSSNLTKSASRGAHSPVRGHPRGSVVYYILIGRYVMCVLTLMSHWPCCET